MLGGLDKFAPLLRARIHRGDRNNPHPLTQRFRTLNSTGRTEATPAAGVTDGRRVMRQTGSAHRRVAGRTELDSFGVQIPLGFHVVELAVDPLELTLVTAGVDLSGLIRRLQTLDLVLKLFSARLLAHFRIHV